MKFPQRLHTSAAVRVGCLAHAGPFAGAPPASFSVAGSGGGAAGEPGSGGGAAGCGGCWADGSRSTAKTARQLGQVNCPPPGT